MEGKEVGIFYGYEFDGIVQLDDDLDAIPKFVGETLQPGNRYYRDLNNDGIISADKDRTLLDGRSLNLQLDLITIFLIWDGP